MMWRRKKTHVSFVLLLLLLSVMFSRMLPHGAYTLIPTTLATLAWIASLSQDGCDYARLEGPIVGDLTGNLEDIPFLEVGMKAFRIPKYDVNAGKFEIVYAEDCMGYGDYEVGFAFEMARVFAFLALVFGGGGALFLWFSSCFVFGPSTWKWAGYEVAIATFFQILAFCWFGSDLCKNGGTCTAHYGAHSDIIALIFWCISAVLIFRRYPSPLINEADDVVDIPPPTGTVLNADLELPVAGDANVTLPASSNNVAAPVTNVKATEDDAEII